VHAVGFLHIKLHHNGHTIVRCSSHHGRVVDQAVSHRPLTGEARVQSHVSLCAIYGRQSDTETGFSPSTSVFPCHNSTDAPYLFGQL
jgi:hypothetical protein